MQKGERITPIFFATPNAFRKWLQKNHKIATELWVGFHKKATGKPSITWPEAVDQALCFGWIDGVRKSVDADSYMNRFTPRRPNSNWSAVNIKRVQELINQGLMQPAGLRAFQARDPKKANLYSFERENAQFDAAQLRQFRAHKKAWQFFESQPPYYKKLATHWVTSAKQEATRQRRLATLMADSAAGRRIGPMRRDRESSSK